MSRRELHKVMNQMQREKKFPFRPSLTPLTERLAMTARLQQQYVPKEKEMSSEKAPKRKRWEELYAEDKAKREKYEKIKIEVETRR